MATDLHPRVLWAQRKDRVFASIQLEGIKDEEISIDTEKLTFRCKCAGKSYHVELKFCDEIVPEESKQRKGGREFFFDMKKKNTDADYWPRLLKEKTKNQFIRVDFARWCDEDEQEDPKAAGYDEQGLEAMMQQMGGQQGFDPGQMGGMGGDDEIESEDDSDDDEIPDLVEEDKK